MVFRYHKSIGTSSYQGTGEPVERDIIQPLLFRASVWWSPYKFAQVPSSILLCLSHAFPRLSRAGSGEESGVLLRPPPSVHGPGSALCLARP